MVNNALFYLEGNFANRPLRQSLRRPSALKHPRERPLTSPIPSTGSNIISKTFPIFRQLKDYTFDKFRCDFVAALTISFVLVPQAIAYSSLAEIEPIQALISAIFPCIIYAFLGGSPHLSFGPEAFSSVLVGQAVLTEVERSGDSPKNIVMVLTILVGLLCLAMAVIRAGFTENVLSGYLLVGFILGVALLIMIEQVSELLGLDPHHFGNTSMVEKMGSVLSRLSGAHVPSLIVGISNSAFLIAVQSIKKYLRQRAKKFLHNIKHSRPSASPLDFVDAVPEVLVLVVVMLTLSYTCSLKQRFGIRTLGVFENKLPIPTAPNIVHGQIASLIFPALMITITGFIESQSVTKSFGYKLNYFPSVNRELCAFGAANLLAAFAGSYVTFGSLPRSRILFNAGGKTLLVGLMASFIVLFATLVYMHLISILTRQFGIPVLAYLPKPTLASIVFVAAYNLIEFKEIIFIFRHKKHLEIFYFFACLLISLVVDVQTCVLLSIVLSALVILRRATTVEVVLLGKLDGDKGSDSPPGSFERPSIRQSAMSDQYVDVDCFPAATVFSNLVICSIRGPLLFYNCGVLRDRIQSMIKANRKQIETQGMRKYEGNPTIIIDFASCSDADSASMHLLKAIFLGFKKNNTRIICTGLQDFHRVGFLENHIFNVLDERMDVYSSVSSAVESFQCQGRRDAVYIMGDQIPII